MKSSSNLAIALRARSRFAVRCCCCGIPPGSLNSSSVCQLSSSESPPLPQKLFSASYCPTFCLHCERKDLNYYGKKKNIFFCCFFEKGYKNIPQTNLGASTSTWFHRQTRPLLFPRDSYRQLGPPSSSCQSENWPHVSQSFQVDTKCEKVSHDFSKKLLKNIPGSQDGLLSRRR